MYYPFGPLRPDLLSHVKPVREDARHDDDCTGNAGLDGYSRLSRADRETGYRPSVGASDPEWPRYTED